MGLADYLWTTSPCYLFFESDLLSRPKALDQYFSGSHLIYFLDYYPPPSRHHHHHRIATILYYISPSCTSSNDNTVHFQFAYAQGDEQWRADNLSLCGDRYNRVWPLS